MRDRDIFIELLELGNPSERAALLDEACYEDAELRGRVEQLLADHERQESFILDTPLAPIDATVNHPISERAGAAIAPYKLLQQIGEGGMGVVFMAEQTEPIQRTVALKIIKPGMDTRQVIARFEAERQAVAMMDHPNIAKVLDAGTTDSGRPYFVMELVKGIAITKYCDEKHLPLRARLELFVEVCQAVQHAHQKGIIHRDIKPNNVLVAEYDNRAVPKVIDFGVAKATAQRLTERTMFTEFGQVLGTMEYMSPEQSKFNQLDIDTRSDIYSLGVLLYELLAGSTPFEGKRLKEAAFDEMLRIIREEEPQKPSTRLTTSDALPSIAANRHTEPARLSKDVSGELDWIVMKALEKDRNRRYETASGFAADIERHLHDEPVEAGPPSTVYRLKKFIRRNKAGVLAGAVIVAALVLGLTVASIGFLHARRQAQIAVAEASKATAISNLLQQMLRSASPNATKGTEYTVRQMLQDFSAGLGDQLREQPEVEAAIRATIGKALEQLRQPDEARPHLKEALKIRRRIFGENHPDVASSYSDYALLLLYYGKYVEAEEMLRKSVAIYDQLGVANEEATDSLGLLGYSLFEQMRYQEAESVYQKAFESASKPGQLPQLAAILHSQAQLALANGAATTAEALARRSLVLNREAHGGQHPETAGSLWLLAVVLEEQQELDEAEKCLRDALAIYLDQFGAAHYMVRLLRDELKMVLMTKGDLAALATLDSEQSVSDVAFLAEYYKKGFRHYPNGPYRLMQRGNIYALQGDFEKADTDLSRATELAPEISHATYLRALVCFTRGDDAGFSQASKDMADAAERGSDRAAAFYAAVMFVMAPNSAIDEGQALKFAQQCYEAKPEYGVAVGLLGAAYFRVGRYEEAAQKLTKCLDIEEGHFNKLGTQAFGYLFLAMTHHRLGQSDEARDWLDRGVELIEVRQGIIAYWPNSMFAERLRQETETLLGVEREEQPIKPLPQQAPATTAPPAGEAPPVDDQTPNSNN